MREVALCYILKVSLMSGLIRDSWIFLSAPAFSLSQYVVFVEAYEENLLHTDVGLERERSTLSFFV